MLGGVFLASLLGSMHCVGMCGSFIALFSYSDALGGSGAIKRPSIWRSHLSYHLGRFLAYLSLGTFAGFLGYMLDRGGLWLGIQSSVAYFLGGAIILWGVLLLVYGEKFSQSIDIKEGNSKSKFLFRFIGKLQGIGLAARNTGAGAFLLGLSAALLPCGWLYQFVLVAAGTRSPILGAAVMGAFWAGTVPALSGLGVMLVPISRKLGVLLPRAMAVLVIVMGVYTIFLFQNKSMANSEKGHHCSHSSMHSGHQKNMDSDQ